MSKLTEQENTDFRWAIETALKHCKDKVAIMFLGEIDLAFAEDGDEGVIVQILHALSNMKYWRGALAQEVKLVLSKSVKLLKG